jgi:hypothetical protein
MYADGARLFVEVGPRGNLTAFVEDTLRDRPHLAVAVNLSRASGVSQLNHVVALLAAHGVDMRLAPLYEGRVAAQAPEPPGGQPKRPSGLVRLSVALQQLRLNDRPRPAGGGPTPAAGADATGPSPVRLDPGAWAPPQMRAAGRSEEGDGPRGQVLHEYLESMEQFLRVQREVMQAYLAAGDGESRGPAHPGGPSRNGKAPSSHAESPKEGARLPAPVPPPPPAAPDRVAPEPGDGQPDGPEAVVQVLLRLVSEKTGYPPEMLSPAADLEADLGVDSIKRTEILGAFQRTLGRTGSGQLERLSGLKTIQEMADFLGHSGLRAPAAPAARPPLLGQMTSQAADELVARREFDRGEDLFLNDHTFGGRVSATDDRLTGLPLIPLTISLEMMAEAAAALVPGRVLVAVRGVRAHRWLALDEGRVTLQVRARRQSGGEILVQLSQPAPSGAEGPLVVEGTAVFAAEYPAPPVPAPFAPRDGRPSKWRPEQFYAECMFHGPSFRGVESVDRSGADGAEATLTALPAAGLFRSESRPRFLTDPVLLDAAGQIVGYWTSDRLPSGINVFPYAIEAVHLYAPPPPAGERFKARARIQLIGDVQVRSDIDLVGPDGRLFARIVGWEDRRFDLPGGFYRLSLNPLRGALSTPWPLPAGRLPGREDYACRLVDLADNGLFLEHGGIWERALAHLVLGGRERAAWRDLQGTARQRLEWLFGRCAAKDAVRELLERRHGVPVYPADVEVFPDEHGRPCVRLDGSGVAQPPPAVAIAHAEGAAAAVAVTDASRQRVGLDLGRIGPRDGHDGEAACPPGERELLEALAPDRTEEFAVRLRCARGAAASALGQGCPTARGLDAETGEIVISAEGEGLPRQPLEPGASALRVWTGRQGDLVLAVCIQEKHQPCKP